PGIESEDEHDMAARNGNVLLAVGEERDRSGSNRPTRLKLPERLAGRGIERKEIAFIRSAEDEVTGSRHHAGPGGRGQAEIPRHGAGLDIERAYGAPRLFVEPPPAPAGVIRSGLVFDVRL